MGKHRAETGGGRRASTSTQVDSPSPTSPAVPGGKRALRPPGWEAEQVARLEATRRSAEEAAALHRDQRLRRAVERERQEQLRAEHLRREAERQAAAAAEQAQREAVAAEARRVELAEQTRIAARSAEVEERVADLVLDETTELPAGARTTSIPTVVTTPGRRRAVKHVGAAHRPGLRLVPSVPVLVGLAALAVSAGGAALSQPGVLEPVASTTRISAASAATGFSEVGSSVARGTSVTRGGDRQQAGAAGASDTEAAEAQAEDRAASLAKLAAQVDKRSDELAEDGWILPVTGYRITNTFGMARSYYSSGSHTGLDFACTLGTPISAIAGGTVTFAGSDGSYGNKTVITLEDGTEIWYAHQSAIQVQVGQQVARGDQIGLVGSTGNSSGPHVHIEVRPGGGDPVDPQPAFVQHGVTP